VSRSGALRSLAVEIELIGGLGDPPAVATRVTQRLREALGLTVPIRIVPAATLPRFEMKARRFVVEP
jgi:phenylacetate-coenzyme A ligase PaaK-like adenylate-forming protein